MHKTIIATHGELAKELVKTVHMITGLGDKFTYLCMKESTNASDIKEKLETLLLNQNAQTDHIFILTDVFGGSITNICTEYLSTSNIHIISGVNLPMLLEHVCLPDKLPPTDVIDKLISQAKQSVIYVNALINGGKSN